MKSSIFEKIFEKNGVSTGKTIPVETPRGKTRTAKRDEKSEFQSLGGIFTTVNQKSSNSRTILRKSSNPTGFEM